MKTKQIKIFWKYFRNAFQVFIVLSLCARYLKKQMIQSKESYGLRPGRETGNIEFIGILLYQGPIINYNK